MKAFARRLKTITRLSAIGGLIFRLGTSAFAVETPPIETVDLGNGVTMDLVLIPAGSFEMGSPSHVGEADESPPRTVTISETFYLGKLEVTQEQWVQLMETNPSRFQGRRLPVDSISWNDARRFLQALEAKTKRRFFLPTEAEWEYACRAGTSSRWSFSDNSAVASDYAWFESNSKNTSREVGRKKANDWGLYDMHGNVAEWCSDWYAKPDPTGNGVDPRGPSTGESRVVRGGAWGDGVELLRSAYRNALGEEDAHDGIGFRCGMKIRRD